jgi:DNA-directed RNA polymerase specialized sigma subunit
MMTESLAIEVAESLRALGEKERDVLTLFFGLGDQHAHSLEEIGDKYHSPANVYGKLKIRLWPDFPHIFDSLIFV